MRILVVEDNIPLSQSIKQGLENNNFSVDVANDGLDGEFMALSQEYSAILLDINLPNKNGFEILESVRREYKDVPILVLSARDDIEDRTRALNSGADDYITKPFDIAEVSARIRAVIRRSFGRFTEKVVVGDLELNPHTRTVTFKGELIDFKPKEFDILEFIAMNHPNIVSSEAIAEHVYDENYDPFSSVMRVHLARIRKKLSTSDDQPILINIRGKGYQLCDDTSQ